MSGIFITGCGTDIGKTITTSLLLLSAKRLGINATVFKPIQTGCSAKITPEGKTELILPDLEFVSTICCNSEEEAKLLQKNNSYKYLPACSPHLAANISNTEEISISKIYCDIKEVEKDYDLVIVEGAGGILVPVNLNENFRDLAVILQYETILVANNKLGCINDALLSVEALVNAELPPLAIIMNNTTEPTENDNYIRKDNPKIISTCSGVPSLCEIPYTSDLSKNNLEFWNAYADKLAPTVQHVMSKEQTYE